ncbi:MAG: hypothetical protein WAV05_13755 [Anaerolineales bacterium]
MVKSGLIFGVVSFLLTLVGTTLITPLCAPCLGLVLGLAAGYVAGNYDKPGSSSESIRKGAIAGAIAGSLGFLGGMIGGVINGVVVNPTDLQGIYNFFGLPDVNITKETIWLVQIVGAMCIGLFNIGWMAILGVAGGALWYQMIGKNQTGIMMPPQEPTPPSL